MLWVGSQALGKINKNSVALHDESAVSDNTDKKIPVYNL